MAGEVVAPAVRVLDYGWQAPNPIDYSRLGLAEAEPIQRAISEGNSARNQFLLSELSSARAMQMAKWQHETQLQREQIRYNRMVDVAKLRADAQLNYEKEKGALDDIKSKNNYLTSRLGGDPVARLAGETDEAYNARISAAIKDKLQSNIMADTHAAYSIKRQIDTYNKFINDPRVNQAVQGEVSDALKQPNVIAQAQNFANTNFNTWLGRVAGDRAGDILDEMQKAGPGQQAQVLQRYGLVKPYNDYVQAAQQQAAYTYIKATGSPAAKQFATANENLKILNQQYENISKMPGDNGRMVPKPWWSQVQNSVDDMFLHDAQEQQKNNASNPVKVATTATSAALIPKANPFIPPPDSFAGGGVIGAIKGSPAVQTEWNGLKEAGGLFAPGYGNTYSDLGSVAKNFFVGPTYGAPPVTPDVVAAATAARNARMQAAGIPVRPFVMPRPVVSPTPTNNFGPAASVNPVVAPAVPVAAPTNVMTLPTLPPLQQAPAGASLSPFIGMPPTGNPQTGWQNPYDQIGQMMAYQQLMQQ